MHRFFAYIRVSTAKQGEQGVSLQEQRDAIVRYAERNGLAVASWFEERETAAKRGRPLFGQMLKLLQQGKAQGVIIHKIDRSARNLKDWADLGELIDRGIEVRFANESLDLTSRGGRLSADIQAVVAADYIRNLREETRKGFYGRLKQGLYPLPAPLGYLDRGKGKAKEPDPATAGLVRLAFEMYASGQYTLASLADDLYRRGLRNRRGGFVGVNRLSELLNNPFYAGLIRLKRTKETFPGVHGPLITMTLFRSVHDLLHGRATRRGYKHDFLYRRLLTCASCGYSLIGEVQKGHVYYRCHSRACPATSLREEAVEAIVLRTLAALQFTLAEQGFLRARIPHVEQEWLSEREVQIQNVAIRLSALERRLARLTDVYVEGALDRSTFEERKAALLAERVSAQEQLTHLKQASNAIPDRLVGFLELVGSAYSAYKVGLPSEKRELLRIVTSNRRARGKSLELTLSLPFKEVGTRGQNTNGAPYRDSPRTLEPLLQRLVAYFTEHELPQLSRAA